ncbi:AAA-like domain-containing protein [Pseudoalteromonas sp. APC 3250]|uniref:AAA-like domain-containing protein n=1 Tax=Pseudoalteromonas sp. APC 3250 TaxID=3035184 RepID=UPI0025B2C1A7|nr:AAA-like domain-containing protein [Pseudoalteromonas sp. APC 3250]MDN3413784.1 AAA-like domain-containing protein [Pseudoalteromonas sp. APC 3250]
MNNNYDNDNKKLGPYTIIPSHLYVERSADTQIKRLLNDMGRPGYILVARQMGKTNLLLNAKRELETDIDIFAYIDLSNRFETDRECFRNIIDKIIDSNFDKLKEVESKIEESRVGSKLPAHREHVRELRLILSQIKGKLIINLDEIDSLTAADYSDKIFAQIRSVFFERVNFIELERLNYILSGVAEPSDIIKDKSISPFNIGQKILLGDFTRHEFDNFLVKASLHDKLSENMKDRVYYWTGGNPRLTWEVLSEVENIVLDDIEVQPQDVDKIVQELYLNNYDRPPIDHIRSLMISSPELREGVLSIYYNKLEQLTDSVKSKLYLAGILSSDYEKGSLCIKNKIIERSLSLDWLVEVNKSKKVSLSKAEEYFENKEYEQAKELYRKLLKEGAVQSDKLITIYNRLGACYFLLGEYGQVIATYEENMLDKETWPALYVEQLYMLACSYFQEGMGSEAQVCVNELSTLKTGALEKHIKLLQTKIKLQRGIIDAVDIEVELEAFIAENDEGKPSEVISSSYFTLGKLKAESSPQDAFNNFILCKKYCESEKHKIKPLIHALSIIPSDFEVIGREIISLFSAANIFLDEQEPQDLDVNANDILLLINTADKLDRRSYIEELFNTLSLNCVKEQLRFGSFMLNISLSILQQGKIELSKYMLSYTSELNRSLTTADEAFMASKYLAFSHRLQGNIPNQKAENAYFKGAQNYITTVDQNDIFLFERKILDLIKLGENHKARSYCDLIISIEGINANISKARLLTILLLKMRSHVIKEEKKEEAEGLLKILNEIDQDELALKDLTKADIKRFRKEVNATIVHNTVVKQIINERKYRRNEVVDVKHLDSGEIERKIKYKKVMEKHRKQLCEILDSE